MASPSAWEWKVDVCTEREFPNLLSKHVCTLDNDFTNNLTLVLMGGWNYAFVMGVGGLILSTLFLPIETIEKVSFFDFFLHDKI